MKRALLAAAAATSLSCVSAVDFARSVQAGDGAGAVNALGQGIEEGKQLDRELSRCDALEQDTVTEKEERSMGGAIAVAAALHLGGLRIAATPVKSAAQLAHPETLSYPAEAPLNRMTREVARLGAMLGARSSRPALFWTFAVIDDPSVNAFSAPGGYVFVSRGLLEKVKTENELAGVLAHEISHVTEKHAIKAYLHSKVWGCKKAILAEYGSGAAKAAAAALLGQLGVNADGAARAVSAMLSATGHAIDFDNPENFQALKLIASNLTDSLAAGYARDQELEADRGAIELEVDAGYDPAPFIALVKSLPNGSSTYLSHHPDSGERAAKMEAELASLEDEPFVDRAKLAQPPVALSAEITSNLSSRVATDAER